MLRLCVFFVLLSYSATADQAVGGASFRNTAHRAMKLYWVSNTGKPEYMGRVGGDGASTGFVAYVGNKFFWAEEHANPPVPSTAKGAKFAEFVVSAGQRVYFYEDDSTLPNVKSKLEEELNWMADYKERTGIEWVGTAWPRPPVTFDMWRPEYVGQQFFVPLEETPHAGHYYCDFVENITECLTDDGRHLRPEVAYQSAPDGLVVECVSIKPKAFRVVNFLTDFETDYLVHQAAPMLGRSTVGDGADARDSGVRTSKSAWLPRGHSEVLDAIYARVGIITRVPDSAMQEGNVESLNVLNYPTGAEYTPHYDWTADGKVASRFVTALMYLNTPEGGGATSFPQAVMPNGTAGTEIPALKNQLAFFYDLLEDGNADELSMHAGTPVTAGEKWVAPLWIWEPSRAI